MVDTEQMGFYSYSC